MESRARTVFVVHGRNESLRKAMFAFLRSIGLDPLEWSQAIALTGEGAPYVGRVLDKAFDAASAVVVLMTPDDMASLLPEYANGPNDPASVPQGQPRPNVLFEAGMALGRHPTRTVLVEIGNVRAFSDVVGRHIVRLNNSTQSRQTLAVRLRDAGCTVKLDGTDWHEEGDFTPPPTVTYELSTGRHGQPDGEQSSGPSFELNYFRTDGSQLDALEVVNTGASTAYNVVLEVPANAALDLHVGEGRKPISRIPPGQSVTKWVYVRRGLGQQQDAAFDVTVSGETEDGSAITAQCFVDVNRL